MHWVAVWPLGWAPSYSQTHAFPQGTWVPEELLVGTPGCPKSHQLPGAASHLRSGHLVSDEGAGVPGFPQGQGQGRAGLPTVPGPVFEQESQSGLTQGSHEPHIWGTGAPAATQSITEPGALCSLPLNLLPNSFWTEALCCAGGTPGDNSGPQAPPNTRDKDLSRRGGGEPQDTSRLHVLGGPEAPGPLGTGAAEGGGGRRPAPPWCQGVSACRGAALELTCAGPRVRAAMPSWVGPRNQLRGWVNGQGAELGTGNGQTPQRDRGKKKGFPSKEGALHRTPAGPRAGATGR